MKTPLIKLPGIFLLMSLSSNLLFAQSKVELSGGIGLPEVINLKLKYGANYQVGVSIGTNSPLYRADNKTSSLSLSLDIYHHFIRHNDTIRSKWYYNSGISFWPARSKIPYEKYLFFYLRFGRVITLSKQIGINIDMGLTAGEYWYTSFGSPTSKYSPLYKENGLIYIPALSLSFFVRL